MSVTIDGSAGVTTNTGAVYNSIQSKTAISASGTSVDFTGIPSWVKRITVMFNGVSTNGTSTILVRLGYGSTTYANSGYASGSIYAINNASYGNNSATDGFTIGYNAAAANLYSGIMTIVNVSGNVWVCSGSFGAPSLTFGSAVGGNVTISSVLTAVRVTTSNGTDTFDAGSINILYE